MQVQPCELSLFKTILLPRWHDMRTMKRGAGDRSIRPKFESFFRLSDKVLGKDMPPPLFVQQWRQQLISVVNMLVSGGFLTSYEKSKCMNFLTQSLDSLCEPRPQSAVDTYGGGNAYYGEYSSLSLIRLSDELENDGLVASDEQSHGQNLSFEEERPRRLSDPPVQSRSPMLSSPSPGQERKHVEHRARSSLRPRTALKAERDYVFRRLLRNDTDPGSHLQMAQSAPSMAVSGASKMCRPTPPRANSASHRRRNPLAATHPSQPPPSSEKLEQSESRRTLRITLPRDNSCPSLPQSQTVKLQSLSTSYSENVKVALHNEKLIENHAKKVEAEVASPEPCALLSNRNRFQVERSESENSEVIELDYQDQHRLVPEPKTLQNENILSGQRCQSPEWKKWTMDLYVNNMTLDDSQERPTSARATQSLLRLSDI